ncbi:MAG: hypothetical protein WA798_12480 [Candidatus Acidiferrum sp.]
MIELKQADSRYIADKLFRKATNGLTVAELLNEDARLASYTLETLQAVLSGMEADKFVCAEEVEERGKVYRPLVFDTFEDLCRAKASCSIP